jgi:AraC-like DNA-binding protein
VHDYFVIGLVESGAQSYSYRGVRHVTPRGHVFLVNPDEPHTGEAAAPEGYVYRTLYARLDYLVRVAADVGTRLTIPYFEGAVLNDPHLADSLCHFHSSLTEKAPKVECEWLLLFALARLIARHASPLVTPRPVGKERSAAKRAREYIEAHFAEDVALSKLAALVSLSPYYFARSFEREIGIPPHTYLESVRIRKAREFLNQGQTLISAALSAGYGDQSHLTRRFKRFLGITPGQYAKGKIRQD